MKRINHQQIIVPLEFKIACTIYKLDVAEVLQIFIDHVTLYNLVDKTYEEGFSEAIHSIIYCIRSNKRWKQQSIAMRSDMELYESCARQIEIIAAKPSESFDMATKRRYSRHFVAPIFEAMERSHTPSNKLYFDEHSCLVLSQDFCVLCEIYRRYPKEYLEYFMGKISVGDAHAYHGLKIKYDNFIFDFFMKIATGFGRNTSAVPELSEREIDFYEVMAELPLKLYHIRSLERRIELIRALYFSHYQAMNQH